VSGNSVTTVFTVEYRASIAGTAGLTDTGASVE
jgi:hypothetical protein